jgi:hypothetical protein
LQTVLVDVHLIRHMRLALELGEVRIAILMRRPGRKCREMALRRTYEVSTLDPAGTGHEWNK